MPILLYPPAYCGLELFCRHPMNLGALPSNRIALGNLAGRKPIQFCQFTAVQVLHNPSSYSNGCSPVVIGLRNKIALSLNLCESAISRPNRNVQILYV